MIRAALCALLLLTDAIVRDELVPLIDEVDPRR